MSEYPRVPFQQGSAAIYIHSRWVNEAAFDNHVSQAYTKQFVEEVQPLVDHELDTTRANRIE